MKNFIAVLLILAVAFVLSTSFATEKGVNVATTFGNHSYLPINQEGTPAKFYGTILILLNEFETTHPNLKITGWKIEKNQQSHSTPAYIFGLWIDHEPHK